MGLRKVEVDVGRVCEPESNIGGQSAKGVYSSYAEMLISRADTLNARDRALMKMYLKNGLTFGQIARIAGTNPSTIARRIRKLTMRLADNEYIACLHNRDKFDRYEITIAKDYYMDGMSQKQIAKKRGISVYSTRRVLQRIGEILNSCGRKRSAGSLPKSEIRNSHLDRPGHKYIEIRKKNNIQLTEIKSLF